MGMAGLFNARMPQHGSCMVAMIADVSSHAEGFWLYLMRNILIDIRNLHAAL